MKETFFKVLSAVLIGMILGAAGMNLYFCKQFEEIIAENKTLKEELNDATMNLENLKERVK